MAEDVEELISEAPCEQQIPGIQETSTCLTLLVSCAEEAIKADIRRTEPSGGTTAGSVVMATGGLGRGFYATSYQFAASEIVAPLLDDGYQILEVAWLEGGWFDSVENLGGPPLDDTYWEGPAALACRMDRLTRWLRNNAHPQGQPYCGTGQSGGGAALAYTVTHHDAESLWDSLVLAGGPPMADLAFGCQDEEDPCDQGGSAEPLGCYGVRTECGIDQAYGNTSDCSDEDLVNSFGPCQTDPLPDGDPPSEPDWIAVADADSISVSDSPPNDYSYLFAVHFLFGNADETSAPAQGVKYRNTLDTNGTETSCQVVGENGVDVVPHNIAHHEKGAQAIYDLLSKYCVDDPDEVDEADTCDSITPVP